MNVKESWTEHCSCHFEPTIVLQPPLWAPPQHKNIAISVAKIKCITNAEKIFCACCIKASQIN